MEVEKLIECVRKFEFLYNLQHPKYMDSIKKEMAWKDISEELKQPAVTCKQRWQGLRDGYRRALNKKKCKSGQAAKKIKKWKYEDEMSFVASFLVEKKKTLDSLELTSDEDESQNKDAATEDQNSNFNNEINSTDAVDVAAANDTKILNENDTIVRNKSPPPQHSQAKKAKAIKKTKVLPVQSASAVLMSRLLDEQNTIKQQLQPDELDRFFLNISETVKKISPYLQAMAKNKIFSLVSDMELQQLAPPSFNTQTTPQNANIPASTSSYVPASGTPKPPSSEPWNLDDSGLW